MHRSNILAHLAFCFTRLQSLKANGLCLHYNILTKKCIWFFRLAAWRGYVLFIHIYESYDIELILRIKSNLIYHQQYLNIHYDAQCPHVLLHHIKMLMNISTPICHLDLEVAWNGEFFGCDIVMQIQMQLVLEKANSATEPEAQGSLIELARQHWSSMVHGLRPALGS